jgi:hypothetical protein
MSHVLRRAAVLIVGLPFVGVGAPDAWAGGDDKPRIEVDHCKYLMRSRSADHDHDGQGHGTDAARPGGGGPGGGGGGKTPSCSKTFAKWSASAIDVYVDDAGAPPTVSPGALSALLQNAIAEWGCSSGIGETPAVNFLGSSSGAEITVRWGNLGTTGILGQAATTYASGVISRSDVTMNSNQSAFFWTEGPSPSLDAGGCAVPVGNGNASSSNYDLLSVLTHEIGHSLGLSHPNNRCRSSDACYAETMYSCTDAEEFMRRSVNAGDAAAISTLYGSNP